MATIEIPKYNKSLRAFSGVIQACAIVGISMALIGSFWIVATLENGQLTDLGFPFLIAYTGQGLVGLAIAGALLRHTAKVIVDGLGGTLSLEPTVQRPEYPQDQRGHSSGNSARNDSSPILEDYANRGLNEKEFRAWDKAGRPDLRSYAENPNQNFFDWLLENK